MMQLLWAVDFRRKTNQQFQAAQKFVDSEVLTLCEPYVPVRTGALKRSGRTGTKIGSGVVKYTAKYAKARYFTGKSQGGLRGKFWFSRMKADHKKEILNDTKEEFK